MGAPRRLSPKRVKELHAAGLSDPRIAAELGASVSAVWVTRCLRLGLPAVASRRWSAAEVRELRRLTRAGVARGDIARAIGRTVGGVYAMQWERGMLRRRPARSLTALVLADLEAAGGPVPTPELTARVANGRPFAGQQVRNRLAELVRDGLVVRVSRGRKAYWAAARAGRGG